MISYERLTTIWCDMMPHAPVVAIELAARGCSVIDASALDPHSSLVACRSSFTGGW